MWDAQEPEDGLDGRELHRGRRAASGRLGGDTVCGAALARVQTLHFLRISQRGASETNCGLFIGRIVVAQSYVTSQKKLPCSVPGLGWASVCILANDLLRELKIIATALRSRSIFLASVTFLCTSARLCGFAESNAGVSVAAIRQ